MVTIVSRRTFAVGTLACAGALALLLERLMALQGARRGLREEREALVPTHSGALELPSLEVVWWNTREDRLERTSLPDDLLPDPDKIEDSLYLCLLDAGIRPVRANQRISAVLLTDEETKLLGVPPGSAALSVQRIAYLETGRVMEMSRALYRSDAYDLVAELGIGSPMKPQD